MTAETLKKYRTINYDANGKPVSVLLDLKNKKMREVYEKIIQKLEDEADWEIYEQYKSNPDKETRDFFEVANEILAQK